MDKIKEFQDEYRFLSNFWELDNPISFEGLSYRTTEHAYQAAKTLDKEERIKIRDLKSAGQTKRAGKDLKLREDWEQVKLSVMEYIVKQKFQRNKNLKKKLIETGNVEIIEGNTWHDNFWGACTCGSCRHKVKENNLGKILMKLREEFQSGQN